MQPGRGLTILSRSGWSSPFVAQRRSRSLQKNARSFSAVAATRVSLSNSQRLKAGLSSHQQVAIRHASWFSRSQTEPEQSPQSLSQNDFVQDNASTTSGAQTSSSVDPSASATTSSWLPPDSSSNTPDLLESSKYTNDYVGFLVQDYGIDFGWGTSELMKTLFEYVHVYSGFSFAGSIICAGFLARCAFFFVSKASVENSTKMAALAPITKPLMDRSMAAQRNGDMMGLQKARQELKVVYQENDVKMSRMLWQFLNIPIGFGFWRTFRNMTDVPVIGLSTGGVAWFTDLTMRDPYFVLPLMTAGFQHLSAKWQSENQASVLSEQQRQLQKVMIYGLPCLGLCIISWVPAAVQLHFATTSFCALVTNVALRSPVVRSYLGMSLKPKEPSETKKPYTGTITVNGKWSSGSHSTNGAKNKSASGSTSAALPKTRYFTEMWNGFRQYGVRGISRGFIKAARGNEKIEERYQRDTRSKARTQAKQYESRRRREIEEERVDYERYHEAERKRRM